MLLSNASFQRLARKLLPVTMVRLEIFIMIYPTLGGSAAIKPTIRYSRITYSCQYARSFVRLMSWFLSIVEGIAREGFLKFFLFQVFLWKNA